jgi:hypothetical protein
MPGLGSAFGQSHVAGPDSPYSLMQCDTPGEALHRPDSTQTGTMIHGRLERRIACWCESLSHP